MIQKVFIRNVSWIFYAKSKFCVCFEVHIPVVSFPMLNPIQAKEYVQLRFGVQKSRVF